MCGGGGRGEGELGRAGGGRAGWGAVHRSLLAQTRGSKPRYSSTAWRHPRSTPLSSRGKRGWAQARHRSAGPREEVGLKDRYAGPEFQCSPSLSLKGCYGADAASPGALAADVQSFQASSSGGRREAARGGPPGDAGEGGREAALASTGGRGRERRGPREQARRRSALNGGMSDALNILKCFMSDKIMHWVE